VGVRPGGGRGAPAAAGDADLAVDVLDVTLDGAYAEHELGGDRVVRSSLREEVEDLALARCQERPLIRRRWSRSAEPGEGRAGGGHSCIRGVDSSLRAQHICQLEAGLRSLVASTARRIAGDGILVRAPCCGRLALGFDASAREQRRGPERIRARFGRGALQLGCGALGRRCIADAQAGPHLELETRRALEAILLPDPAQVALRLLDRPRRIATGEAEGRSYEPRQAVPLRLR